MKIELSNGVVVIPTQHIEREIIELLWPKTEPVENKKPVETEPTKLSAKFRRKFEQPAEPRKPQKGGYSPEEEANIIKMYNLGHGAGEIGRKVGNRSASTMNAKINYMIVKGQMKKRPKLSMQGAGISMQTDDEEGDDGFKTL